MNCRTLGVLALVAAMAASAQAQSSGFNRKKPGEKDVVWSGYNKPGSVQWTEGFDLAVATAREDRKLLMVVYFVGEMKFEGS